MAITSIDSYAPTTLAFYDNWGVANSELTPGEIALMGAYKRADFFSERTQVIAAIEDAKSLARAFRVKAAERDMLKLALVPRVTQFRFALIAQVADPVTRNRAPKAPHFSSDIAKFTEPLKAIIEIWTSINTPSGGPPPASPLILQGGYTLAQLTLDAARVQTLSDEAQSAERAMNSKRELRSNKLKAIYERMKQYRAAVFALLPKNSPARHNLPRLTPVGSSKPKAVTVSGGWDAVLGLARLSWEAATGPDISKLQVRGCTGRIYNDLDEEVIADLLPTATHWEGDWNLTVPGHIATFKVYVMTTPDNENGGKAVKIARPLPQP